MLCWEMPRDSSDFYGAEHFREERNRKATAESISGSLDSIGSALDGLERTLSGLDASLAGLLGSVTNPSEVGASSALEQAYVAIVVAERGRMLDKLRGALEAVTGAEGMEEQELCALKGVVQSILGD